MTCRGPNCSRKVRSNGLCDTHYRQEKTGKPLRPIHPYALTRARAFMLLEHAAQDRVAADARGADRKVRHRMRMRLSRAAMRYARARALAKAARAAR